MDADGLPLIGIGVDLSKVEAISAKRRLAFINHFITHTVSFLNRFSTVCEEKLEDLTIRMQRLETTMCMLEAKLASIPGLENVTIATTASTQAQQNSAAEVIPPAGGSQDVAADSHQSTSIGSSQAARLATTDAPNGDSSTGGDEASSVVAEIAEDPLYQKYRQMIKVGVPLQAIRPKMLAEGLDPAVLENQLQVQSSMTPARPPCAPVAAATAQERKESISSDFSDNNNEQSNSSSEEISSDFDD